jgi:hypothetical protein
MFGISRSDSDEIIDVAPVVGRDQPCIDLSSLHRRFYNSVTRSRLDFVI